MFVRNSHHLVGYQPDLSDTINEHCSNQQGNMLMMVTVLYPTKVTCQRKSLAMRLCSVKKTGLMLNINLGFLYQSMDSSVAMWLASYKLLSVNHLILGLLRNLNLSLFYPPLLDVQTIFLQRPPPIVSH